MAEKFDYADLFQDMGVFLAWLIFGVMVGWVVAYVAHGSWMKSPYADYYGIAGAGLAVLWVTFRRQKHLQHLGKLAKKK